MSLAVAVQAGMPLQLGLAGDPLQIFGSDCEISGLKLNLPYAENDIVKGLDLGFVSGGGEFSALRLNGVNLSESRSSGLEIGAINFADGEMVGMQTGVFNRAGDMHGFQFGIVNCAGHLHGLQLGLLNIVADGHAVVLPFINWGF